MKDPMKLEVTNRRRKSIQTRRRDIQCEQISWGHCEGSTMSYFNVKYYHAWRAFNCPVAGKTTILCQNLQKVSQHIT